MAVKEGWRGRFFEDFEVGDIYEHPLGRTVTTTDNIWFTLLTQHTAPMKNLREDDWERTVNVLCKDALNCIGAVLEGMLARVRGHIITFSSDAGRKVCPGLAVYSGSKFFVEGLSQGLRLETAGTGLKVTTVQPGNVATELHEMSDDEEAVELYAPSNGTHLLNPEDVAASVVHALRQPEHVAVNEILVGPRDEPV